MPWSTSGTCQVPVVGITGIQVRCAAGKSMWIDNQVKPCDIETRLEREMALSRHRSLRSQTMAGENRWFSRLKTWTRRSPWDVLVTNARQIVGAQRPKVTKDIPPLSLCSSFLMLNASLFAATSTMGSYSTILIPQITALVVPEAAGEVTLFITAMFFLSGTATIYFGDLADKWRDFRGIIIGLNTVIFIVSVCTWIVVRHRAELGWAALPSWTLTAMLMGMACGGVINITYNLVAIYSIAYPDSGTTLLGLVSCCMSRGTWNIGARHGYAPSHAGLHLACCRHAADMLRY